MKPGLSLGIFVALCLCFIACDKKSRMPADPDPEDTTHVVIPVNPGSSTYNVDSLGLPRFATHSYIGLDSIVRISKFRSGIGHSYGDNFEGCRSMKHYFQPRFGSPNWGLIPIYAPASGTVSRKFTESAGWQVQIRSTAQPAFTFILFHVTPTIPLDSGTAVAAGQLLGHHVGTQTTSDIAVSVNTPTGFKLVSWFDVMTDSLFAAFQARGVPSLASAVITRAARDAQPLTCSGEAFADTGSIPNWLPLTPIPGDTVPPTPNPAPVQWTFNGELWVPSRTPPACPDPLVLASPVDMDRVSAMLYPGQYRGTDYKVHGGYVFDGSLNEQMTMKVAMAGSIVRGSRYIQNGEVQYMFDVVNACGISFRYDHLLTLSDSLQAIANTLPAPQVDNSATTDFNPPIPVGPGFVLATALGFMGPPRGLAVDFGVYDLRRRNAASQDTTFARVHGAGKHMTFHGVCWLTWFDSATVARVQALPGTGAEGKNSDFCE